MIVAILVVIAVLLFWFFSPLTVAIIGICGLVGVVFHEAIHAIAAVLLGYKLTDIGVDGLGPYVEYEAEGVDPFVQLAPTVVGLIILITAVATLEFPQWIPLVALSVTLWFAPLDWADAYNAMHRNAS